MHSKIYSVTLFAYILLLHLLQYESFCWSNIEGSFAYRFLAPVPKSKRASQLEYNSNFSGMKRARVVECLMESFMHNDHRS